MEVTKKDTIDPKRRKITNHAEDNEETFKPSRKTTKMKKKYIRTTFFNVINENKKNIIAELLLL